MKKIILDVSDHDTIFRERVLDKILETSYLSRKVDEELQKNEQVQGCCQNIAVK